MTRGQPASSGHRKSIHDHYLYGRDLGTGGSGHVRVCLDKKNGKPVAACKSIPKSKLTRQEAIEDLRAEVASMRRVRGHPHIVSLKRMFEDEEAVHLVMDLCDSGDLYDHLSRVTRMSEAHTARLVRQLLLALSHCHRLGVVHRDIKPENILVLSSDCSQGHHPQYTASAPSSPTSPSSPRRPRGAIKGTCLKDLERGTPLPVPSGKLFVKLADFGLSVTLRPGESAVGMFGSSVYMAPEVVCRKPYGTAVDIWGLGVVLYTALSGFMPFWGSTDEELFIRILRASPEYTAQPWPSISHHAKDLIHKMLSPDPSQRISAEAALRHPWILRHCGTSSKGVEHARISRAGPRNPLVSQRSLESRPCKAISPPSAPLSASRFAKEVRKTNRKHTEEEEQRQQQQQQQKQQQQQAAEQDKDSLTQMAIAQEVVTGRSTPHHQQDQMQLGHSLLQQQQHPISIPEIPPLPVVTPLNVPLSDDKMEDAADADVEVQCSSQSSGELTDPHAAAPSKAPNGGLKGPTESDTESGYSDWSLPSPCSPLPEHPVPLPLPAASFRRKKRRARRPVPLGSSDSVTASASPRGARPTLAPWREVAAAGLKDVGSLPGVGAPDSPHQIVMHQQAHACTVAPQLALMHKITHQQATEGSSASAVCSTACEAGERFSAQTVRQVSAASAALAKQNSHLAGDDVEMDEQTETVRSQGQQQRQQEGGEKEVADEVGSKEELVSAGREEESTGPAKEMEKPVAAQGLKSILDWSTSSIRTSARTLRESLLSILFRKRSEETPAEAAAATSMVPASFAVGDAPSCAAKAGAASVAGEVVVSPQDVLRTAATAHASAPLSAAAAARNSPMALASAYGGSAVTAEARLCVPPPNDRKAARSDSRRAPLHLKELELPPDSPTARSPSASSPSNFLFSFFSPKRKVRKARIIMGAAEDVPCTTRDTCAMNSTAGDSARGSSTGQLRQPGDNLFSEDEGSEWGGNSSSSTPRGGSGTSWAAAGLFYANYHGSSMPTTPRQDSPHGRGGSNAWDAYSTPATVSIPETDGPQRFARGAVHPVECASNEATKIDAFSSRARETAPCEVAAASSAMGMDCGQFNNNCVPSEFVDDVDPSSTGMPSLVDPLLVQPVMDVGILSGATKALDTSICSEVVASAWGVLPASQRKQEMEKLMVEKWRLDAEIGDVIEVLPSSISVAQLRHQQQEELLASRSLAHTSKLSSVIHAFSGLSTSTQSRH